MNEVNLDQEPTSKPTAACKFSGLDYDAELALPMPKPRHARPEEMPSPTPKQNVLAMPNFTKKRSTTEPALPTDSSPKTEPSEKKKSKVATLRSKFSLKDLGKEFRKEIPPLSSLPKLGGGSGSEAKRPSSDSESRDESSHSFSEARLYVPKTRKDNVHPNSAPPQTSSFDEAAKKEKRSQDSILSCPSMSTLTKGDSNGKNEGGSKHSLLHVTCATNPHLETLLLDGSSPAARTGECNNTGQPEIIEVEPRMFSLKAENNDSRGPSSPQTPPLSSQPVDSTEYSPSIYDTPERGAPKTSEPSLPEKKETQKAQHPLIVSSSSYKGNTHEPQTDDQLFMNPRTPPLPPTLPPKAKGRGEQRNDHNHIPVDDSQFCGGVTSHGGYAPPPPHPGYQNTMTLEQQLAGHVDSLHYHINSAALRVSRTFENSNNWTADQILRQIESMSDLARVINSRTATEADIVKDLPQLVREVRLHINAVQQETYQLEDRMKIFVQREISQLKADLSNLILSNSNPATLQTPSFRPVGVDASYQGGQLWPKPTRDGNKQAQYQNKRKSRQMPVKRDDLATNKVDNRKPTADPDQENNPGPVRQAETATGNHSSENGPRDNIQIPTVAFCATEPKNDNAPTPVPAKRAVSRNQDEASSGSPESKSSKVHISTPLPVAEGKQSLESNRTPALQRESDHQPRSAFSSEDLKTPKKKGMFSFRRHNGDNTSGNRFLRTPRRTKEGKSTSEQSQVSRLPVSTTTTSLAASTHSAPAAAPTSTAIVGAQIRREVSPSRVHPAFRNPHQRQIMLERERHLAQVNHQIHGHGYGQEYGQTHSHPHPLRVSHSHHNFDARVSGSNHLPLPPLPPAFVTYEATGPRYASGISVATASSSSSFQSMRAYEPSPYFPHSSSTPQLSSPPHPPQGQGQSASQHYLCPPPVHGHGHGPSPLSGPSEFGGVERSETDIENEKGNSNGPVEKGDGHPTGNFF
ncbi:uncharacterized protein BJX67DRAFT_383706 [Aspergillus lucknowensis]|uniref:Uncharacterized protein n=1 Tax=Aspergillus lucknowensis TaxID=176173 RepID=A0ABR4LLY9_9EURO